MQVFGVVGVVGTPAATRSDAGVTELHGQTKSLLQKHSPYEVMFKTCVYDCVCACVCVCV